MNRRDLARFALVGVVLAGGVSANAADAPPTTWDGLVRVPSKKIKYVYLAPKTNFAQYTKVMIDPTEVAFDKDWIRNYNQDQADPTGQIDSGDIKRRVDEGVKKSTAIFDKAFSDGGYQVVTAPGPDVLRVRTALLNIQVASPDLMSSMSRTWTNSSAAGSAMLVVEVRDSQTNALLGRAITSGLAGNDSMLMRNSVTNWSDFQELVKRWAKLSVAGLTELKATPQVVAASAPPG
jgi:hypothetical protein